VALLGDDSFEAALSSLLPLCAVPLMRLGLSGDVPRLVSHALPATESLLRIVRSRSLPPAQREAGMSLALDDIAGAVVGYVHRVAAASEARSGSARGSGRESGDGGGGDGGGGDGGGGDGGGGDGGGGDGGGGDGGGGELRRLLEWAAASWRSLRVAVDPLGERAGGASSLSDPARRSLAALALATRLDPKVQGRLSPEVEAPLLRRFEEQVCAAAPE